MTELPKPDQAAALDEVKAWILQNQLARRNLCDLDRIDVTEKLRPLLEAQAKERQRGGQGGVLLPVNLPEATECGETRTKLAEMAGVSERTYDKGVTVLTKGSPEVQQAVRKDTISLSAAVPLGACP